jgi:hypothetical protein
MRNLIVLPALLAAAAAVSGCVSLSRSSPISALTEDWSATGRISEVRLDRTAELKVTPEFDGIFKSHVEQKLAGCAKGTRPLRLEARIDRLDKANPVMTTVIGGANVLRGNARIVDVATGQVVGDYAVGATIVGGRLGVIQMAQAEEQLSDAFGDELCKQAFKPSVAN